VLRRFGGAVTAGCFADALVAAAVPVAHIMSGTVLKPHQMSEFAREIGGQLVYPGLV
jgi:hypothetical protein